MAIDRDMLKEYLAITFPGPGVRRQIGPMLEFVLDQDESAQQSVLDAWKDEHKTKLQEQKAEVDAQSVELQAKLDALG